MVPTAEVSPVHVVATGAYESRSTQSCQVLQHVVFWEYSEDLESMEDGI